MIKSFFHKSKWYVGTVLSLSALLSSCSDERFDSPWFGADDSDAIRIGAAIKPNVYSRGYIGSGTVTEGDFYLTYPFSQKYSSGDTIYTYKLADARFGTIGAESMGFVTYVNNENKTVDLKWSDISLRKGTPGSAVFYLDNVSPNLNDKTRNNNDNEVVFRENEEIPFQAGVFNKEQGINDLLWGTAEAQKNTKKIDFILHHCMSRLRVIINVKPRTDNGAIVDLSHVAKVEITNLHQRPESFDRTTGNLILPLETEYEPLTLVEITDENQENDGNMIWESVVDDESVTSDVETWPAKIYTSQDFVLPPQELINDSDRPTLRVTIPAKYAGLKEDTDVVYEAFLPQNMYASDNGQDDEGTSNRRPMPLSFLREHILTLNATIGPPEMELQFAPVYVEDWIDMGEHSITGQQAGIYNNDDFFNFLEVYKAGNTVLLEKYGYKSGTDDKGNDKWIIMFWSRSINLEREDIDGYLEGHVHEDIPFSFSFNNYVLKVTGFEGYNELSGAAGQIRLYNILTGEGLPEPGIKDHQGFLDMMKWYNAKNNGQMQNFGAYDNTNEQWVFEFTNDAPKEFELDYEEIHGMMDTENGAGNFTISFRGHTVKITNLPNGESIVLEGEEGEALLHAILSSPEGLYTLTDITWLVRAYNSVKEDQSDPANKLDWILELYGKQSSGKWIFTFRRGMELDGPSIYGCMIPDPDNGLLDYSFSTPSGVTVKVGDGTLLNTPGATNLKKLFAAAGQATTAAELQSVITSANGTNTITRRYYGKYREQDNKWEYPVNGTFEIAFNLLFGKLTSIEPIEITMVGESKVTIIDVPGGYPSIICRGAQGADIIYRIMRGTYNLNDYPDPGLETPGDFTNLFTAYNANNTADLQLYGNYSAEEGKWVFEFTPTAPQQIEVEFNKIRNMMSAGSGAGEFRFNFGSHSVKVTNLPGGDSIVLDGTEGEALLHAIVTQSNVIESNIDLQWLINAYNAKTTSRSFATLGNNSDWIFELFGTKSSTDTWTFTVGRSLRVNGSDIYGRMVPDAMFGKPEFNFTYASQAGVQVVDGNYTENVNNINLVKLFALSGKVNSQTDLVALANSGNNPITRRYYGTEAAGSWSFTVTTSFSVDYNSIFGKLVSTDYNITLGTGVVITLTGLPAGYRPVSCQGSEGAQTLVSILRGTYTRSEAGIESLQDVTDLIEAYNTGNTNNMLIYGTNNTGKWTFTFLQTLQLQGADIFGKMVPASGKPDYDFAFAASKSVTVIDGTYNESNIAANLLKKLFAASGSITSADNLMALIAAGSNTITRRYYGTEDSGLWSYPIMQSFSVDYNSIFRQLTSTDYSLSLASGVTVTLSNLPAGFRPISCQGTQGAQTLTDILRGTYTRAEAGIESVKDVNDLIAAYNDNNTDNLQIYGTYSGSKWTFTFLKSVELQGSDIYGRMTVGGNRADYDFVLANSATVTVKDGSTTQQNVSVADLKKLFTNEGTISSLSDFTSMLAAGNNPIVLRYYGSLPSGTWTFPITASLNTTYESIFNEMKTTYPITFTLGGGINVTVREVPYNNPDIVCTGTDGADTLLTIVNGSYIPKEPEPEPEPEPGTGGEETETEP